MKTVQSIQNKIKEVFPAHYHYQDLAEETESGGMALTIPSLQFLTSGFTNPQDFYLQDPQPDYFPREIEDEWVDHVLTKILGYSEYVRIQTLEYVDEDNPTHWNIIVQQE